MIRVGVNGYGTIGRRVADAVRAQPDMRVEGVAKRSPDAGSYAAVRSGYPIYASSASNVEAFETAGLDPAGDIAVLTDASDVMIDATPAGVGAENASLYADRDTPAVFQGGEDAGVAERSFNARSNYESTRGAESVRVVSCNSTGLLRLAAPIDDAFGIDRMHATLVRRGGDPDQPDRGPINDIVPDPVTVPSHHAPDVNEVLPDLDVDTVGLKVPATRMHVHSVNVTLSRDVGTADIRNLLARESRIALVSAEADLGSCGALQTFAEELGRRRGELWENCVWTDSITTDGTDLYLVQAIDQRCDVVPENVDAIRAVTGSTDAATSMARTDEHLGVGFPTTAVNPGRAKRGAGSGKATQRQPEPR
ncbi:MAG: type II glyceraldehyde-3-phosphate dehydrogenase [Halobacteriales archaeon]